MKRKRMSNREFFERNREHFERSDRVHREWLERFEEREAAKRAAQHKSEDEAGTS